MAGGTGGVLVVPRLQLERREDFLGGDRAPLRVAGFAFDSEIVVVTGGLRGPFRLYGPLRNEQRGRASGLRFQRDSDMRDPMRARAWRSSI